MTPTFRPTPKQSGDTARTRHNSRRPTLSAALIVAGATPRVWSSAVGVPQYVLPRPWTRLGVLTVGGHLGYELAFGVGVPLAPRVGITAATTGYAVLSVTTYRAAGHLRSPRGDRRFAVANGLFASAVISHFSSWPRTTRMGLPWLTESEGLEGGLIGPYNALLYLSAVAAVGGAAENRCAWRWFAFTPLVVVPVLRRGTPVEYQRLLTEAAERPRWWNRRLTARVRRVA